MQLDADGDPGVPRLINREKSARWSTPCSTCKHSRADHVVDPLAVTSVFAVSDCNRATWKEMVDTLTGKNVWVPADDAGDGVGKCGCDQYTTA